MASAAKRLQAIRVSPRGRRIEELISVALAFGLLVRRGKGSHVVFMNSKRSQTVPAARPVKPYYVRALLELIDDERTGK